MICKNCGQTFLSFMTDYCPYCGFYNEPEKGPLGSLFERKKEPKKETSYFDPYGWNNTPVDEDDWDNPENNSDEEYMDDEDYDDFDN